MKKQIETSIAETLVLRLGIDPAAPNDPAPMKSQAYGLKKAICAICDAPDDTIVLYRGRAHTIVKPHPANPDQGTQLLLRPGALVAAQLVLAPEDEPNQYIEVHYSVVRNLRDQDQGDSQGTEPEPQYLFQASGNPTTILARSGNPTTILARNNLLPVTVPDPQSGATPPFPRHRDS